MLPFGSYDELPLPFEHQSTSENQLNYAPHYDIQTIIPIAEYEESSPRNSSPPDDVSSPFSDEKTYKSLPRNKCPSKCLVCRNAAIEYHMMCPLAMDVKHFSGERSFREGNSLAPRRKIAWMG
uniref:Nuclear receptor domain-containing protein n=1 Tax=Caenorhabditis japonica TaxID=281687 RepID=A0A8R1ET63_CAEJA